VKQAFQFDEWKTSTGVKILLNNYNEGKGSYTGLLMEDHKSGGSTTFAGAPIHFNANGHSLIESIGFLKTARCGQEEW
jgi:hypothetical protein